MSAVKRRFRLPRLKITEKRVGSSEVVRRVLSRDEPEVVVQHKRPRCEEVEEDEFSVEAGNDMPPRLVVEHDEQLHYNEDDMMETSAADIDHTPKISLHSIKQKANVAAWESIRPALLTAVVECCAMPEDQLCTLCCVSDASFRCKQCGPCVYYCSNCIHEWHNGNNIFHTAEEWKVFILVTW